MKEPSVLTARININLQSLWVNGLVDMKDIILFNDSIKGAFLRTTDATDDEIIEALKSLPMSLAKDF
jgi:hypothetical protein